MKNLIVILSIFLFASYSHSQSDSSFSGMWKITTDVSGPKSNFIRNPSYLFLDRDNTYIWGIDSASAEPMKTVSKGEWAVTDENEIKLIPEDTSMQIMYFRSHGGPKFKYEYLEKNGKKEHVFMLEMDMYIEKYAEIRNN